MNASPRQRPRTISASPRSGTIVLVSLAGRGMKLGEFCAALANAIVIPIGREIEAGRRDREELFPVMMVDTTLRLGVLAAQAEHAFAHAGDIVDAIVGETLRVVCTLYKWAQDIMRVIDWLAVYLTRRWRLEGASPERLRRFVENFDADVEDHLDLSRDSERP